MNFIILYRYNILRIERFILNDNTNSFIVRDGLLEFFILRNVWMMQRLESTIRLARQELLSRRGCEDI
jgi:hypothetical protein